MTTRRRSSSRSVKEAPGNKKRKPVFKAVIVPHLPKAEPIKTAEPELRKRERAAVALQRNHGGYMQAKGLQIVQDVEKYKFLFYFAALCLL